jgi:hypothetical protein
MSKSQLSAALVLVALFGLPATANAATSSSPAPSTASATSLHFEHEDDEFEDEDESEYEEEAEGEEGSAFSEEDDESFVVPPVVMNPSGPRGPDGPRGPGRIDPEQRNEEVTEEYLRNDVPDQMAEEPIMVDQVLPTAKTPTDLFVDSAVVGLGAVGAGALALGTMVGVRAIRSRRSGEKADYFYGE